MNRTDAKKYRERANRAWRELRKEKETYGEIDDGAGKRYRAPVDYVLAGDPEKALEVYGWVEHELPDDIGEPAFDLYWVLAAYRAGEMEEARRRFPAAMIHNLYMVPYLIGEPWEPLKIWHGTNQQRPEYLAEIEDLLQEPTVEEREWMRQAFHSEPLTRLREQCIEHFEKLHGERDIERRREILDSWRRVEADWRL